MANLNNQGLRQQSVRDVTGTTYNYTGDWMALFEQAGITQRVNFDGNLLTWINTKLSSSYTNLPQAQQAFAENQGFLGWDEMGTFDAS